MDDLEDLLGAVPAAVPPPSAPPLPSVTHQSRDSRPIPTTLFPGTSVGGDTEGDGDSGITTVFFEEAATVDDSKGVPLVIFEEQSTLDNVCRGFIGGTSKFCLKHMMRNTNSCGVAIHGKAKFDLKLNHFYITKSDTSAFCQPVAAITQVPEAQLDLFRTGVYDKDVWMKSFTLVNALEVKPDGHTDNADLQRKASILKNPIIKTPGKVLKKRNEIKLEEEEGTAFFDVEEESYELPDDFDTKTNELPAELLVALKAALLQLKDHSAKIFGLSRDLQAHEKITIDMSDDLELLDTSVKALADLIGSSSNKKSADALTIIARLEELNDRFTNVNKLLSSNGREIHQLSTQTSNLDTSIWEAKTTIGSQIDSLNKDMAKQSSYWTRITPLLAQIRTVIQQTLTHPLDTLERRIKQLENKQHASRMGSIFAPKTVKKSNLTLRDDDSTMSELDYLLGSPPSKDDDMSVNTLEKNAQNAESVAMIINNRIKTLEDSVDVITRRQANGGVRFKDYSFHSLEDLMAWMRIHLVGNRFGIFLDGVSIWTYFFGSYRDTSQVITDYHGSNKIGFSTLHDTKVAASFQNVLPAALGKGSEDTEHLPGLSRFELWDNQDGSSGLKYRLSREIPLVKSQVSRNIKNTVGKDSEAKDLATECLNHSAIFVDGLGSYISRAYEQLVASAAFDKDKIWAIICRCVKRVFDDISSVRITAKDSKDNDDPLLTAAQYIWATLKAHGIMEEYIIYNFEDHPAFASVITRFVIHNSFQSDVSDVTALVKKETKRIDTLTKRFDSLQSKFDKLEKRVEKLE